MISIIVPCYKSANTLAETLQSVLDQDYSCWEVLIINDGSPDDVEDIALKWTALDSRFKYFKKENEGLGTARNYGIKKSSGKYILPLDSDNKVKSSFLRKAIRILEANNNVGVVYGNAEYFGEQNGIWHVGDFKPLALLDGNYIDACAVFRKSVYNLTKGYDQNLPYQGHEDWDFWLQVLQTKFEFYYLDEITFDYRVTKTSMIRSFTIEMEKTNIDYIRNKNHKLYVAYYPKLYALYKGIRIETNKTVRERFIRKLKKYL